MSSHVKDAFEAVLGGRGQTQHAEVSHEAGADGVAAPAWGGAGCRYGHVLQRETQSTQPLAALWSSATHW